MSHLSLPLPQGIGQRGSERGPPRRPRKLEKPEFRRSTSATAAESAFPSPLPVTTTTSKPPLLTVCRRQALVNIQVGKPLQPAPTRCAAALRPRAQLRREDELLVAVPRRRAGCNLPCRARPRCRARWGRRALGRALRRLPRLRRQSLRAVLPLAVSILGGRAGSSVGRAGDFNPRSQVRSLPARRGACP
jgi:hypothetical protein